jgi:hypothetical protein
MSETVRGILIGMVIGGTAMFTFAAIVVDVETTKKPSVEHHYIPQMIPYCPKPQERIS